jgi:predicted S18 family serine protease
MRLASTASGRPHTGQRGSSMTGTTTEKKMVAPETMALWVSIISLLIAAVAAAFAVYIWYVGRIEAKKISHGRTVD